MVSVPDEYLGERSCAFIIPKGERPRPADLKRWIRTRGIADFKVPDQIVFVDAFASTAALKISRKALRPAARPIAGTRNSRNTPRSEPGARTSSTRSTPPDMTALSLESMRADIARMLRESPADIRDDDDLMDLGLDSMRLMKLAAQWREAGARLEFADLAVEATLAQWWALVAPRPGAPGMTGQVAARAGAGGTHPLPAPPGLGAADRSPGRPVVRPAPGPGQSHLQPGAPHHAARGAGHPSLERAVGQALTEAESPSLRFADDPDGPSQALDPARAPRLEIRDLRHRPQIRRTTRPGRLDPGRPGAPG